MARTLAQVQADLAILYATRTTLYGKMASTVTSNGRSLILRGLEEVSKEIKNLEQQETALGSTPGGGMGVAYASFSDPQ